MFEPSEELDVNEPLAEVVKSRDTRLWEGFPVLLANAADTYQFAYDLVEKQLPAQEDKDRFHRLLLVIVPLFFLSPEFFLVEQVQEAALR